MKKLLVAASISLLLSAAGMAQTAKKASDAGGAMASLQKAFADAANAKDVAKMTALYTDDAILMPSNAPMAKGHAAIQAVWKGLMDAGARDVVLATVAESVNGNMAYVAGTYTFSMNGPGGATASDKGKFLLIAHLGADGKWLIHYDIFNSDLPCSGGAGK